jgi:predicted nucleic acid-binding protein
VSLVVLDASAAVEIALRTPDGARLAGHVPRGSDTYVPEHFYVETAAALRRMELAGAIGSDRALLALRRILDLRTQRGQVRPLLPETWTLRHNVTVADGVYVVLARRLGAVLVTADQRIAGAPKLGIQIIS